MATQPSLDTSKLDPAVINFLQRFTKLERDYETVCAQNDELRNKINVLEKQTLWHEGHNRDRQRHIDALTQQLSELRAHVATVLAVASTASKAADPALDPLEAGISKIAAKFKPRENGA